MANGAAHDAALHIATAFVARHHTVAHQKRSGADVVGDHAQRTVVQILATRFTRSSFDQRIKQINFVIAVHMLQDGRQALQAHAGVHTGRGQWRDGAVFRHIELHENVVPNFDETVSVFVGAAGRTARNMGPVVIKNLATRTARTGVGHHPEVVAFVAPAFVVANAYDAVCGQADFFGPNVVSLIVFLVNGGEQTFFG